jgi:DNA-binding transcriptional ArsR family regulator
VDVFAALADPNRRAMLDELVEGERPAGALAKACPQLSQPAVSQHLKVLREAGLVDVRVDGQRRLYRRQPAGLDAIDLWLLRHRHEWTGRLDALEHHLVTDTAEGTRP